MPITVPKYNGPQVAEKAIVGTRVNTELPANAVAGAGSEKIFKPAMDILQKGKDDADQLAIMEADKKLTQLETSLLYDKQNGALNRRGKDAFGLPDEVGQSYSKSAKEIEDSLSNPNQKFAFQRMAQDRGLSIDRTIQKHVGAEIKNYDDQETSAYVKTQMDLAVTAYQDPDKINQAIESQKVAIAAHAQRNGMPPEWIKLKTEEAQSQTHAAVIDRMLANGDDRSAKSYFDANKDFIDGKQAAALEKDLHISSIAGESQRISDKIYASGLSMTESISEAKKVDDPKLRDATIERIKDNFNLKKVAERDAAEKTSLNFTNMVDKGMSINDIMKKSPRQWAALPEGERSSLKRYYEHASSGKAIETDFQQYYDLKTLASSKETQDSFLETNLMQYRDKLGNSELKELMTLQAGIRNGDDKSKKQLDGYRTDKMIVDGALAAAGYDTSLKGRDADKVVKFQRMVDEQVAQIQEKTGKKATNADVQKITDGLMIEVVTNKGLIWDTKKRAFDLESGEDVEDIVIAKDERRKIEDSLKRAGRPVNTQSINELYLRKMKGASNASK